MSNDLIDAIKNNDLTKVDQLTRAGADVNYLYSPPKSKVKSTPLNFAILEENVEIIRYLIDKGANLDQCHFNEYGNSTSSVYRVMNIASNFYYNTSRIKTLECIFALLCKGGALITDVEFSVFLDLESILRETKKEILITDFFHCELLLRANLSLINQAHQYNISFPSPETLNNYLKIAPRSLSDIQLQAIHNVLNVLAMNNTVSKESASAYQEIIGIKNKIYCKDYSSYFPSYNDTNHSMALLEKEQPSSTADKIMQSFQHEIATLKTDIQYQNKKIDTLVLENENLSREVRQLISLINTQQSRNTESGDNKPVHGLFATTARKI